MLNVTRVGEDLKLCLASGRTQEALNAIYLLLSNKGGEAGEYSDIARLLFSERQFSLACAIEKKAFFQDPFRKQAQRWYTDCTIEEVGELETYLRFACSHFERIAKALDHGGELVFVDLGSSSGDHFFVPKWLANRIHSVSLDGLSIPEQAEQFGRRSSVKSIVAGSSRDATFNEKYFLPASSLLPDDESVVDGFGMEQFARVKQQHSVRTVAFGEVLNDLKISYIDALKTDLEGLDFEVVKSIEPLLPKVSFLRMEMAFLPRYIGEPRFHEPHQYLIDRDFVLMGLKADSWRYNTEHRDFGKDGRIVWGDFEYVNDRRVDDADINQVVRHVIVTALSGYQNYAEHLIETRLTRLDMDLSRSLKFVLFAEISLVPAAHVNQNYPHAGG